MTIPSEKQWTLLHVRKWLNETDTSHLLRHYFMADHENFADKQREAIRAVRDALRQLHIYRDDFPTEKQIKAVYGPIVAQFNKDIRGD